MEILGLNKKFVLFVSGLDSATAKRVRSVLKILGKYGTDIFYPHSKPLGKGLFELRIVGDIHIRIFYIFYKNKAFILHWCIKKSNRIPSKELKIARLRQKLLQEI